MIRAEYDHGATMRAWEDLLAGSTTRGGRGLPVRSLIHDSWTRCLSQGIDAGRGEAPLETRGDVVEHRRRSNSELLAAARKTFSTIGQLLDGTGTILILTDSEGVLIDVVGDRETVHHGMDIHLAVGGKWTEDVVGTNGIGTALCTGEPVFVHAAEHFCAGIKSWTCAGAPIRDPFDGSIIGVVDLSGHPEIFRPHNTAFVAAAAHEIEKALAERQRDERMRLLEAFISAAPRYREGDGLLIIDRLGRPVYRNNLPEAVARELQVDGLAAKQGARCGVRLPSPAAVDTFAQALPAWLRSCHFSPLHCADGLTGATLIFPAQRPAGTTTVGARNKSERQIEAAAGSIVGKSEPLLDAIDIACRVGVMPDVTSLLIEGETGVGKELFARLVHTVSRRTPDSPFIVLNCGAITKELFGNELFGHAPSAFTGASRDGKPGVFELAHGGVLCLDEIGEMPLEIQPFLLRVLEERVVQRIGDGRPRAVDVRLIASTNRDLRREVEAGRFRRDLYYRISAISIHVPPLRERGQDILLLLEHFNGKIAARSGREPLCFRKDTLDLLLAYGWPGNVRELRNLVERLHVGAPHGEVGPCALPAEIRRGTGPDAEPDGGRRPGATAGHPVRSIEDVERGAILDALVAGGGNLSQTAQRLGISRPTLYRKLEQFGIRRGGYA